MGHPQAQPTVCSEGNLCVRSCADVMYIEAAVPALVNTLLAAAAPGSEVLLAHGRNRQAEPVFLRACERAFAVADVSEAELDAMYCTSDVRVLRLRKLSDIPLQVADVQSM